MVQNYYVVLGVPRDASPEAIHEAYRRLVKESHPDIAGADSGERFREVQEAWETLGDAERRRAYDSTLKRAARPIHPQTRPTIDVFDPASSAGFASDLEGTYVSSANGQEIHFGLQMTAAEAARGGDLPVRIPIPVRCVHCAGHGSMLLFFCPSCRGSGYQTYWRTATVPIPAGLNDEEALTIPLVRIGLPRMRLILHVEILA